MTTQNTRSPSGPEKSLLQDVVINSGSVGTGVATAAFTYPKMRYTDVLDVNPVGTSVIGFGVMQGTTASPVPVACIQHRDGLSGTYLVHVRVFRG